MIVLIFTGGTISMRTDTGVSGAVPALTGRDIVEMAPGIERIAQIEIDDFGHFPGPHMTPARMWELRAVIAKHLARPEVQGVVVTHGTDTLEESAYLMARSLGHGKPIVFTGAMRTSTDLGWDGPANLGASVLVAASDAAKGHGSLVVLSDRIYSALDETKVHTHMVDAFESPGLGPLGVVDDGEVIFRRSNPLIDQPTLMPERLAEPVDIITAFSGADSRLLETAAATAKAIVLAALGRGNVPPAMLPGIRAALDARVPVVITSRAMRGRVGYTYGYEGGGRRLHEMGCLFAGSRRPQQARIDLMLALGANAPLEDVFNG